MRKLHVLAGLALTGTLLASAAQAQIRVAVEDGSANGSGAGIVAQLNDDTFFDFAATLVTAGDIDTLAELAAYDAVVLGGSGFNDADWTAAMASALRSWVESGCGAVFTGWGNFDLQSGGDPGATDLEAIFPTQNVASTNEWGLSDDTIEIVAAHPVVAGISDFAVGDFDDDCCIEANSLAAEAGDTVLATMPLDSSVGDGIVVAVKEPGAGRTVYLGPIYMGSTTGYPDVVPALRSGTPDQLLEQAVAWAACSQTEPPPSVLEIPTASSLGLASLMALLALSGLAALRLRR